MTSLLAAMALVLAACRAQDAPGGQAQEWEARLTEAKGEVTVWTSDGDPGGMPGEEGAPLEVGDRVRTGKDGSAEIAFEGDSIVTLRPNSEIRIADARRGRVEIAAARGGLLAKIQKALGMGGGFRVRTPTAVAAVRGTEFAVEIEDGSGGETHVGVFDEGEVEVSDAAGGPSERLIANQETVVRRGQRPAAPYQLKRLMKHRRYVRGMGRRAAYLRKNWKALSPDQRRKLRGQWRERAGEQTRRRREKLERQQQRRQERAKPASQDREKMEKRRQRIREKRGR